MTTQYRVDNELLHLEWETKFCALLVTAELNTTFNRTR